MNKRELKEEEYNEVDEQQIVAETKQNDDDFEIYIADSGMRFAHFLIDGFVILSLTSFCWTLFSFTDDMSGEVTLLSLAICFIYYSAMEFWLQATVGKMITSSKVVVLETGERPGIKTILIRSAIRLIPFEPFIYLFRGCAMHDSGSGTIVIKERKSRSKSI
jgi:uncharacterized RDD family membrane protein YckC